MSHPFDLFLFLFPLVMSIVWTLGGLIRFTFWEVRALNFREPSVDALTIPVTIIVPCFNEERQIAETIERALQISSHEFEVIAVDDGSTDATLGILAALALRHDRLRVISLGSNQGKAAALQAGARAASHEFLLCIDGDAMLDRHAPAWIAAVLRDNPAVGGVTGNPRIGNRRSVLGKIQVGEFSAMIGLIKRTQMLVGQLFTLSGVIAGFRKRAVHEVDYWTRDALTEDMDITWKLQRAGWRTCFEPRALVWILTPETLRGLWRQRLRWAMGGAQVLARNIDVIWNPAPIGLKFLVAEMLLSVCWSYLIVIALLGSLWTFVDTVVASHFAVQLPSWLAWSLPTSAVVLFGCCVLQMTIALFIDRRYDAGMERLAGWLLFYPLIFWLVQVATTVVGFPLAASRSRGRPATWISPDRGMP
ncbi:MAG: poly-beta-1,6 N-acetyl-D-glucosamine synthase [Gammaproteobacteria bacterium]|jgi:biofilm PGA synthesis N-glycosyltransferase PgaC|nr:poly-beta-1,6 N-acetyl-D-glucosamine synthase [Gammaproteobacteria bacterium]